MSVSYSIALLRDQSGPEVDLPGGVFTVPSPAVLRVHRPYSALAFEVTIERVGERWPVVTALKVISAEEPPEAITAVQLRDMRFGQVRQACVRFLQRGALNESWADERFPDVIDIDEEPLEGESDTDRYAPEWMRDLPPYGLTPGAEGSGSVGPNADWLAAIKMEGPSSERTLRAVAALYRVAVTLGKPPNLEIQQTLQLPNSTASRWIQRAREEGFLDQSPRKPRADRKRDA